MRNFLKIADGINVMPLLLELQRQPELWNQHRLRKDAEGTPHNEMDDIWLRYNDFATVAADPAKVNDEHTSVWYPGYYALPALRPIIFGLMAEVQGEQLGGVLITRIPPGCKIAEHVDAGWHVEFYEKFYLSLMSRPGANFYSEGETICPRPGDIYWFDNRRPHRVENHSEEDRITLIMCIRAHRFGSRVTA